jgi:peptide/nickel transport system substrate-binding protein
VHQDTVVFDLAGPIQDPKNFNWYTPGIKREHGAHQAMWEPLFLLNYDTGQIEPWLAAAPPIPTNNANPIEWVLTLRRGVTWSDGKPFTADDVVFTVNELALKHDSLVAQEVVTIRQQLAEPVTRIDNYKVHFKLRYPNPRFARESFANGFFGSFLIMPKHVWGKWLDEHPGADPAEFKFYPPIGTGPYKLKEASETHMVWERDNNWWGAKAPPGGGSPFKTRLPIPLQLEWRILGSDAQSKTALEKNEIDAAREMTLAALRDAQGKNSKIIGWDTASPLAWNDPCARQLDVDTLREPWTDPRLRRAVSLLIDRKALAGTVYHDTTIPSRTLFPEYGGLKTTIDAVVSAGYGIAPTSNAGAAEALVAEAGWTKSGSFFQKNDQTLAVTILVDAAHPNDVAAAREVARQLTTAGIDANTKEVSTGEYWGQAVPKGDYAIAFSWLSCGSVAEPYTSLARYAAPAVPLGVRSPGFNNTGRWSNQAYADIVTKELGPKILKPEDERAAIVRAYKYLNDEMPLIPLVQSPRIIPFNTTYWIGWPVKGSSGVPMHSWSATHRLIHALRKAN